MRKTLLAIPLLAMLPVVLGAQSTTMIVRPPNIIAVPNEAATGTTQYKLVKLTGAPSTGIVTTAGDTLGAVGICASGCGVAAAQPVASVANWGNTSCVFDAATTAGHYLGISAAVNGNCADVGAGYPAAGQVIGRVLSTNGGGGTYGITLFGWSNPNTVADAATNTVSYVQKLSHDTSGLAAAGFGVGSQMELENAAGNRKVASSTETTWETATAGAEDSIWNLFTVAAGAVTPVGQVTKTQAYWGNGAGQFNTGANPSMFGTGAGQFNTGTSSSMFGVQAGTANTGASSSMFGYQAGQSNTGASSSMFGVQAGFQNTGANPSMFGLVTGQFNTGANPSMFGAVAGYQNTGSFPSFFGYQRGYQNNWPNVTLLGGHSTTTFAEDATTTKNITEASITAANTITYVAHGFGTVGGKVNIIYKLTGGAAPVGLVTNTVYQFTVTSADVLTLAGIAFPAAAFTGTLTNSPDVHNSIAVGYDAVPTKAHQAVLGNTDITETVLRGQIVNPNSNLPLWYKYALVAIANGVNGCANANGCWQVNGVYNSIRAAGLTQSVVLEALGARGNVTDFRIKTAVVCTGAATANTGLGTTGTINLYRGENYDLNVAAGNTNMITGPPTGGGNDTHAATNLIASLVTTGTNVDTMAAGCAVDYWVGIVVLP